MTSSSPGWHRLTSRSSEALILALALGAPTALGSVHTQAVAVLVLLSGAALISVWLHRRPRGRGLQLTGFGAVLLAALGFTLLQALPLPIGVLKVISPTTVEVLDISLEELGGAPAWHPISLDVGATLWEALKLGACLLAFVAAHNYMYRRHRRDRLLIALVGLGLLLTLSGMVGAVVAPGKPLLLYTPDRGGAAGLITTSFVNPNHGAAFLNLTLLLAMGLAVATRDLQRKTLAGLSAVLLGVGVFLTVSRGGIIALALGMGLLTLLFVVERRSLKDHELGQPLVAMLAGLALILGLSGWLAFDVITQEMQTLLPEGDMDLGKILYWPAGLRMILDNPWVGVGRGAFMTSFTRYIEGEIPLGTFTHMENQYLHLPAEWGLPLSILLVVSSALALVRWLRRGQGSPKTLAMCAALAALALHNIVDFSLEMLGLAMPVAILAGTLSARTQILAGRGPKQESARRRRRLQTGLLLATTGGLLGLLGWVVLDWPPSPWDEDAMLRRLVQARTPLPAFKAAALQAARRHPSDYMPHLVLARQAVRAGRPEAIKHLNRALFLYPQSPQIHLETARTLRRFGRAHQALLEYRLAIQAGASKNPILDEALDLAASAADLDILLGKGEDLATAALPWLRQKGKATLARDLARAGHRRWPDNELLCQELGEALLALGDPEVLKVASACEVRYQTSAAFGLHARTAQRFAPEEELGILLRGREVHRDSLALSRQLTLAYLRRRQFAQALEAGQKLLSLSHDWQERALAHELLAQIYQADDRQHSAQHHRELAERMRQHQE